MLFPEKNHENSLCLECHRLEWVNPFVIQIEEKVFHIAYLFLLANLFTERTK